MTNALAQIRNAMSEADLRLIVTKLGERHNNVIERRAATRIDVGLAVETSVLRGQMFTQLGEAWLENVSEGGLGLLTDRPIPKGAVLRIGFGSVFKDKFLFCKVGRTTRKLERAYGIGARIIHVGEDAEPPEDATPTGAAAENAEPGVAQPVEPTNDAKPVEINETVGDAGPAECAGPAGDAGDDTPAAPPANATRAQ